MPAENTEVATPVESMTDAELNDVIFNSDNDEEVIVDDGISTDNSVSPANEDSTKQPDVVDDPADVDQSSDTNMDLGDDPTIDDQTDDSDLDTDIKADEAKDTDTADDDDKDSDIDDKQSDPTMEFQPLKANGKEYPIESIDELYKLASAGVGAQHKFQAIAGHKKSIMAAEKAGVNLDEAVNFMANYKENPQDAIARLLKANDMDPLDYDAEAEVGEAKDYSVSDFEVSYDEVVGEIGNSPIFPKVQELLLTGWDEASRSVFLDDPSLIKNLHSEMTPMKDSDKSMFDLVQPIAEKMKLSGDSRSDFDVYMAAREQKVAEIVKFEKAKQVATPPAKKPDNKAQKKKAGPTGGNSAGVPTLDFSKMSDAELDAYLEK